jgi:hypothetical protein
VSAPLRPLGRNERPAKIWERFHVGMRVTVREAVEAYYSGYAGNPECVLEPGMAGVVASLDVPYVRHRRGNSSSFAGVDFEGPAHSNPPRTEWRAGVDPKNLVPLGPRGARFVRPPDAVRVTRCPGGSGLVGFTAADAAVLAVVAKERGGIFGGSERVEAVRACLAAAGYVLELVGEPEPAAACPPPAKGGGE